MAHRKMNVRRLGAGWIRPPGVSKTLQARWDEETERKEAMEQARREAVLAELAAAQEQGDAGSLDGEEQDLDDDVPEAEILSDDDESSEEASVSVDADRDSMDGEEDVDPSGGDVSDIPNISVVHHVEGDISRFNEDSLLEGSLVGGDGFQAAQAQSFMEAEDAELDGRAQDMRDLGFEGRDLDDDIPDAGSYQHTDTDLDTSSEDDDDRDEEPSAIDDTHRSVDHSHIIEEDSFAQNRYSLTRPIDDEEVALNSSFSLLGNARRRSGRYRRSGASDMDAMLVDSPMPTRAPGTPVRQENSTASASFLRRLRAVRDSRNR